MIRHAVSNLFFLFLLTACEGGKEGNSPLFEMIFVRDGRGLFRGTGFGMEKDTVAEMEAGNIIFSDALGIRIGLDAGPGRAASLDYFFAGKPEVLAGIALNLSMRDEFETVALYREIESHLMEKYGVPDGGFGELRWRSQEVDAEVILKLDEAKTAILLNFVQREDRKIM